jgi:hypothetical protein
MKALSPFLAILTALSFALAPTLGRAQDAPPPPPDDQGDQSDQGASFQTFYDQLGSQGTWVQTDDYGYVFQPNVSDPDWAPYTDGHWVYTDEGWMWVSDEPWGWATYHYGRWANIDGFGWVWVPGYRWAPAWVSWRYGGGYCGWAPLPPGTFVGAEYGGPGGWDTFHFGGDVDLSFGIGAGFYTFLRVGDMGEPNYHGHYLNRNNNYVIINKTTNVTNINITNNNGAAGFNGVTVGGPKISTVNAHARDRVPTVQLAAASQPGQSTLRGNSLGVYAPRMNPTSVRTAKPASVAQTLSHPTFNRGTSITEPLAVNSRLKPAPPTAEAIQAAKTAASHVPDKARIATSQTPVKTVLSKPLTSLPPVGPVHHTTSVAAPGYAPSQAHPSGTAPYTGESVKPTTTQPKEVKPATTYHPESQDHPASTYHAAPATTQTYHSDSEVKPAPTYHPSSTPPMSTYHPSSTPPAPTYHPSSTPPAQAYHPEPPVTHTAPAPTSPAGNNAPGGNGNKNKPPGQ